MDQGLLLALTLVGGRVAVETPGMKNVAAVAQIVRREDTRERPVAVGWVVWDDTLQPWVAVTRNSPSELRALVPQARHLAKIEAETVLYGPLVGTLPPEYLILAG